MELKKYIKKICYFFLYLVMVYYCYLILIDMDVDMYLRNMILYDFVILIKVCIV